MVGTGRNGISLFENAEPVKLFDDAGVTITDNDNIPFGGGQVTARFTANGSAGDRLTVIGDGTAGSNWIEVRNGTEVWYDADGAGAGSAVLIGTASGGTDAGTPLQVALNGNATPAAVQALVRQIAYVNDSHDPAGGVDAVRAVAIDVRNGLAESVTTQTATALFTNTILVTVENDAPVLTGGATLPARSTPEWNGVGAYANAGETVASLIAALGGNASDVDNRAGGIGTPTDGLGLAVTGAVANANGVWQVSTDGGSTWTDIAGVSADSALLLQPTDRIRFAPAANANGDPGATLTLKLWDRTSSDADTNTDDGVTTDGDRNLGNNDQFSANSLTLSANIVPANDAPVNTVPGTLTGIVEDTDFTFSGANRFNIADVDVTETANGKLTLTLSAGNGVLTLGDSDSRAAVDFDAGDGVADGTVTVTGTLANLQALLASVTYRGNANFTGTDSITITTNDNGNTGAPGALSDTDSITFQVAARNDAPSFGTGASAFTGTVAESGATGVGTAPQKLVLTSAVDDIDLTTTRTGGSAILDPAVFGEGRITVAIAGTLASDQLTVDAAALTGGVLPAGVAVTGGANGAELVITLDADTTRAEVDGLLQAIRFQNTSDTPPAGTRGFTVTLTDGLNAGEGGNAQAGGNAGGANPLETTLTGSITITAANDAPINSVPAAQTVDEDADLVLSAANGNAISVADADAGGADIRVTLSVGKGALTIGTLDGVDIDGVGTGTIVLTGSQASINALLADGLTYRALADYNGPDALTVTTTDLGNAGTDGARTDSDTVAITVMPTNDAPAITGPAAATLAEDGTLAFDGTAAGRITIADLADLTYASATDSFTVTLTVAPNAADMTGRSDASGSLSVAGSAGTGTHAGGAGFTGNGTATLVLTGTKAQIDAALASLVYAAAADDSGTVVLTATVDDGRNGGSGSTAQGTTDTTAAVITITRVSDAPTLTASPANGTEDQPIPLTITVGETDTLGADETLGIVISGIPAGWVLRNNGVEVPLTGGATGTLSTADLANLTLQSPQDWNSVRDNGGQPINLTVTAISRDGAAAPAQTVRTLAVMVASAEDAPVAKPNTGSVNEDGAAGTPSGNLITDAPADTDVDEPSNGGALSVSGIQAGAGGTFAAVGTGTQAAGSYGTLTVNSDGSYSYALDNGNAAVQALAPGQTLTEIFTYRLSDGTAGDEQTSTLTITINGVNDRPVVTVGAGPTVFTEGVGASTPVAVAEDLTVTDVDNATLRAATVAITGGFQAGQDILAFANTDADAFGNIQASYDAVTGIMTLTSAGDTATLAQWQAALRAVTYSNSSHTPTTGDRTISFQADDGRAQDNLSLIATRTVQVVATNDSPVLGGGGNIVTFTESNNAAPTPVVVNGGITVSDLDSTTLTSATVAVTGNFQPGQDVLSFGNIDAATYGNIQASYNAATGVLSLSSAGGTATLAQWQAALRAVTYANTSENPVTADRTVIVQVDDGGAANAVSNQVASTVRVVPVNDTPILTASVGEAAYTEDAAGIAIDPGLSLADRDDTSMTGAVVRITGGFRPGDILGFTDGNGITGNYDAATGTLTLTGTATRAQYEAVLRSVTYSSVSADPTVNGTAPARTVSFQVTDGNADGVGALTSAAATRDVRITAVTDVPTVTVSAGNAAWTENGAAAIIDAGLILADVDDTRISGAVVRIDSGRAVGDVLSVATPAGITASFDAATGTLTLTGTATLAEYQALLRQVTFSNTGDDPTADATATARSISFTVTDANSDGAGAGIGSASRTIAVTPQTDNPVIGTTTTVVRYVEDGTAVVLDGGLTLADIDDTHLSGATVTIGANFTAGDLLAASGTANISVAYNAVTGALTLSGRATVAEYQSVLRSVTYASASADPTQGGSRTGRDFVIRVSDANSDLAGAGTASALIAGRITALADAPVIDPGASATYRENGAAVPVLAQLTLADPDDTWISGARVILDSGLTTGDVLGAVGNHGIGVAYDAATGTLTLTGTATLAQYQEVLRSVTFASTSDHPTALSSTRGLTVEITDADAAGAGAATGTVLTSIMVVPVNDAPVLTLPSNPAVDEDGVLAFTGDAAIRISDIDVGGGQMELALSVELGRLDIVLPAGVSIVGGANGSGAITLRGTVGALNAALAGLSWTPPADYNGPAALSVRANDLGNTGTGGPLTDVANVPLTVRPVNDAPTATGSLPSLTGNEGAPLTVTLPTGLFADIDQGDTITFLVQLADGSPLPAWLSFDPATLTLTGTPPDGADGILSIVVIGRDQAGATARVPLTISINDVPAPIQPPAPPPPPPPPPVITVPPPPPVQPPLITNPPITPPTSGNGGDGPGGGILMPPSNGSGGLTGSIVGGAGGVMADRNVTLFIAGSVSDQVAETNSSKSFQVPANVFRHTNPEERLQFEARQANGEPLPDWLSFDPSSRTFTGTPPEGAEGTLEIAVTARDAAGNSATASFRVTVGKGVDVQTGRSVPQPEQAPAPEAPAGGEPPATEAPADDVPADGAPPPERDASLGTDDQAIRAAAELGLLDDGAVRGDASGKPTFSAQLRGAGLAGMFAEARALLDSLAGIQPPDSDGDDVPSDRAA
ncbi:putative Ig domain-containing protein [Indioceanicola profundi]|uniref:putative Ig domain-containing protein n=1 Tax=Indioceanicola profundi TaxID=2220096 RepID=UPI000E6AA814|nr:putative Ig domain-containing protein [Indioceanicola profundi]